jgi:hypothetical protein
MPASSGCPGEQQLSETKPGDSSDMLSNQVQPQDKFAQELTAFQGHPTWLSEPFVTLHMLESSNSRFVPSSWPEDVHDTNYQANGVRSSNEEDLDANGWWYGNSWPELDGRCQCEPNNDAIGSTSPSPSDSSLDQLVSQMYDLSYGS